MSDAPRASAGSSFPPSRSPSPGSPPCPSVTLSSAARRAALLRRSPYGDWRIPSDASHAAGYELLEVRLSGDTCRVRFDTLAPKTAAIVDGRLRLQDS